MYGRSRRRASARRRSAQRLPLLALWLTLGSAAAIATAAGRAEEDGDPPLVLQVHLFVLESRISQFHAKASDVELKRMFARANDIWAPAGISWELTEISRERLVEEHRLLDVARGSRAFTGELFVDLLPRHQARTGHWHVYLANDLTAVIGAPGIYLSHVPAVLVSEVDPAGLDDPGRILAHELGHSLTLEHRRCSRTTECACCAARSAMPGRRHGPGFRSSHRSNDTTHFGRSVNSAG